MSGFIVRHVRAEGEVPGEIGFGLSDAGLTEQGKKQAAALGPKLATQGITSLRASDKPRVKETIEQMLPSLLGIKPAYTKNLRSLDVGDVADLPPDEAKKTTKEMITETPGKKFPGGQSHKEWLKQIWPEIRLFLLQIKAGQRPAIGVHGRVAATIDAFVNGQNGKLSNAILGGDIRQKHGSIWRVDWDGNRFNYTGPI